MPGFSLSVSFASALSLQLRNFLLFFSLSLLRFPLHSTSKLAPFSIISFLDIRRSRRSPSFPSSPSIFIYIVRPFCRIRATRLVRLRFTSSARNRNIFLSLSPSQLPPDGSTSFSKKTEKKSLSVRTFRLSRRDQPKTEENKNRTDQKAQRVLVASILSFILLSSLIGSSVQKGNRPLQG